MQALLENELLLFNTVQKQTNDWDFSAALVDYFDFMSTDGIKLFTHLHKSAAERGKKEDDIQTMYVELHSSLLIAHKTLTKIVKRLKLETDPIIEDRMRSFGFKVKEPANLKAYDSILLEFSDVIKELYRHGYEDEVSSFINKINPDRSGYSFYDLKPQQDLKECKDALDAFVKEDQHSLAGAFIGLIRVYGQLKRKEKRSVSAAVYAPDLERIHNSIVINNPRQALSDTKKVKIFEIKNDDIYHHEIGKLVYELNGDKVPKYITLFKNIVAYMPEDKIKLRISEFEKHLPKQEQVGAVYRGNLGKSAASFQNFLKENGVKNIHPVSKQPILAVTDEYITFRNIL